MLYAALLIGAIGLLAAGCDRSLPVGPDAATPPGADWTIVLPEGATLDEAVFHAFVYHVDDLNSEPVSIHRVTTDWDEVTVTWNSFHPDGTLNYDPAAAAVIDGVAANTASDWASADVTGLVQQWLDGAQNQGLLLRKELVAPRTHFYSRESDAIPYLEMTFTTADGPVVVTSEPLADAMLNEAVPDTPYGLIDKLYAGWKNGFEKQSVLRFEMPEIPDVPEEPIGCTRTIGYWKTHAGQRRHQQDRVSEHLPIWLGDAGGAHSLLVTDADMAVDVLRMRTYGRPRNGITKLYAQLLAAKLNAAAGADTGDAAPAIAEADAFLAANGYQGWRSLPWSVKHQVLEWKDILDAYNNGEIGPGHCGGRRGGGHHCD
jgi:hypothetical protein